MSFKIFIISLIIIETAKASTYSNNIFSPNAINRFNNLKNDAHFIKKLNKAIIYSDNYNANINDLFENVFLNFGPNSSQSSDSLFPNITLACLEQLQALVVGIQNRTSWALSIIDSFGKPTSGIMQGSLVWPGEYGECIKVEDYKYCLLSQPVVQTTPSTPALKLGTCIPTKCNKNDLVLLTNFAIDLIPESIKQIFPINITEINSNYVTCQEAKSLSSDSKAVVAIFVICLIASLVILGTLYEIYEMITDYYHKNKLISNLANHSNHTVNHNQVEDFDGKNLLVEVKKIKKPLIFQVLKSLSAYSNTIKVFKIDKIEGQLDCLHGIRFFTMGWVILGHTYGYGTQIGANNLILTEWTKNVSFLIVLNAVFAVDSFFLLSGLLTAYIFIKEVSKTNTVSLSFITKYYIHRIWRITPPYMIMVMISATLTKYFGSGPFFPPNGFEIDSCEDSWWTNLLYINNFVKPLEMCLAQSWYLANDMQFHFIAPLILIPLALKSSNSIYFTDIYIMPWVRIPPYIVGVLLGYVIIYDKTKLKYKFRMDLNIILFLISIGLCSLMIFALHQDFIDNPFSKTSHILYQATCRFLWALGLSYIIFACLNKQGGILNELFCLNIWIPLSRLSFCAYLVHLTFLNYYLNVQEHTLQLQQINMVYIFLGTIVSSYAIAFLFSLLFEIPLIGLEKFIFKKK